MDDPRPILTWPVIGCLLFLILLPLRIAWEIFEFVLHEILRSQRPRRPAPRPGPNQGSGCLNGCLGCLVIVLVVNLLGGAIAVAYDAINVVTRPTHPTPPYVLSRPPLTTPVSCDPAKPGCLPPPIPGDDKQNLVRNGLFGSDQPFWGRPVCGSAEDRAGVYTHGDPNYPDGTRVPCQ